MKMEPHEKGQSWYVGAMRNAALVMSLALAACGNGDSRATAITIGETTYSVPKTHITSISRDPHKFVRIKPPETRFELVYDSRTAGRSDRRGWPMIFSLNDERGPNLLLYSSSDLVVVCRRAVNPVGGCGLKVSHHGAEWTVLFPDDHLNAAGTIRERALATLTNYQT